MFLPIQEVFEGKNIEAFFQSKSGVCHYHFGAKAQPK